MTLSTRYHLDKYKQLPLPNKNASMTNATMRKIKFMEMPAL